MTALFDTHCHLTDPAFGDGEAAVAIERARAAGVEMVVCGDDAAWNVGALELATAADGVYPAVGFHPYEAGKVSDAMLHELESLARLPQVVAVGEIGLDFFRAKASRPEQFDLLEKQLAIAMRVGKPISIHTRSAEEDAFAPLSEYSRACGWRPGQPPPGVMHCFGGTLEQATRYVGLGFMISIACTITYPKNDEARRIAAGIPIESLVAETDSPYLPPQFMRGQRNEPMHVRSAVETIAIARGISFDAAAEATTRNAHTLFRIPVLEAATC